MLQQGQHCAVRGLLVFSTIMVLSATRYRGSQEKNAVAGQIRPSILEILVGLWWIRTARLVSQVLETKPIFLGGKHMRKSGETTNVNVVVKSVEMRQWASTQQSSLGLWLFQNHFLCDAIFY